MPLSQGLFRAIHWIVFSFDIVSCGVRGGLELHINWWREWEFWFLQFERRLYSSEEMRVEKLTAAARFKLKLCLLTNLRSFLWIVDYFSVDSTQNMFKSWQSAICIFDNQNWRGDSLKKSWIDERQFWFPRTCRDTPLVLICQDSPLVLIC